MPRSGEVIDDRFTIEHLAGTGGMGQVYRARDHKTGGLVALKVMHDAEQLEIERFARETHVLATLTHPGIVRYIHSGTTAEGEPYLVMEWLSGETLSGRLQRTQITLAETLALGRRVASALGAIHRRGVVHRDIKPSNLFLRDRVITEVALIDFGMARRPVGDPKLTATGTMLGTPGYIAPEQVYNVPNLDGRADIFSLGCVLYRCLSGRAPFHGFRMLLNGPADQLPRLRELRPSIPAELDDLVARMLSRSPDDRPSTGDTVAAELLAIEESEPAEPRSVSVRRTGPQSVVSEIMGTERRLLCLVVARPGDRPPSPAERDAQDRALRAAVERHRGKLEALADGSLLVSLSHADAATDLAARATRCALAIRPVLGNCVVVVVSGREVIGPSVPASELLERAVELLESTTKGSAIRIDELTSALLRDRFDTGRTGVHLRGELRETDRPPLARGAPTACVGREQELAQLETIFDQGVEERGASMVLLTGPAGVGKSRLGQELLRRLTARDRAPAIWLGEADALATGTPFGVLARVLRGALDVIGSDSIGVRREKILSWIARHPDAGGAQLAGLLGELAGTPLETVRRTTRTAPPPPQPPNEQLAPAFVSFLRAECATRPVVLVLEDLQWADLATIKAIDAALGALADRPLLVLALARTKLHELFPQLSADRNAQEIRLRKLSRRAGEQLVRQALGDKVEDEMVKALVERSEGHASYLDEMIRAVADGRGLATPPVVVAMVQARLERLDPEARRVLRAASIFGETFWLGGVEALLGGGDTAAWLAELVEQDEIALQEGGRFPSETEYRFRHPLVREAAYEMLTEGDRVAGHWLAGQWLEQAGETDSAILGEHFARCERGGAPGPPPEKRSPRGDPPAREPRRARRARPDEGAPSI